MVPYAELPFALVHFTGNALINRSMRLLAHQKHMSLSEHGLRIGVIRKGNKVVYEGSEVRGIRSEKDIFKAIGIVYLEPWERNA